MTGSIYRGLKVLDLTRVVSGPWATQMLADMGATVYKVEEPHGGDMTRKLQPLLADESGEGVPGYSAFFLGVNRNKKSLQVDISKPEGADLVRQLAARCDVFVEDYKSGRLKRYGLDYGSIRAVKPDTIYCSITGFGLDGPYAHRPAYDFILQGLAGLMSTCGLPDDAPGGSPMRTAVPITDIFTGLYAVAAIQGALFHKMQTGQGQNIDIGMLDVSVAVNAHLALGYFMTGRSPERNGNANPVGAPSDVFKCADGFLIIAAGSDAQFARLCDVIGRPELAADERFNLPARRITNRVALTALLTPSILGRSKAEWLGLLDAAGVPCAPINNLEDVFHDPQVRHRDLHLTLPGADGLRVPSLRSPLRFSATPVEHVAPAQLGEHTEAVLSAELSLPSARIEFLKQTGVLSDDARGL